MIPSQGSRQFGGTLIIADCTKTLIDMVDVNLCLGSTACCNTKLRHHSMNWWLIAHSLTLTCSYAIFS